MHQLGNVALMFAVLCIASALVIGLILLIDRKVLKKLDIQTELKNGNVAVAIFAAALAFGMFFLAGSVMGAPASDRYDDAFQQHARLEFGYLHPWQVFKAQGMTESGLNPALCSHVGACGVMQFMPGTAIGMGLQDRFDAKESIRLGIKYDRAMWKQFTAPRPPDARLDFAFASYNAGLGNVLKFQRAAERADFGDAALWETVAPFAWKEPREYVERIHRWEQRFTGPGG
jgi:hypothetical protein